MFVCGHGWKSTGEAHAHIHVNANETPQKHQQDVVKGKGLFLKGEDDEPVNYFVDVLPRLRRKYGADVTMYEFIQEPGETVFVPGGWWHAVINLEDSVAVTQNFCSRANFPAVWRKTRSGRKGMARKWLRLLEARYPDLAALARRINEVGVGVVVAVCVSCGVVWRSVG